MASLISMITNTIIGAFQIALKALFSMISWFLKTVLRVIKYFYIILPVTSVVFNVLLFVSIIVLATGSSSFTTAVPMLDPMLENDSRSVAALYSSLLLWWKGTVLPYKGTLIHVFLMFLTIIMFCPVMLVLLCIAVFTSFGHILFFAVCADAALYLLRAVIGQSFLKQAAGRYYRFFKEAGKRHEEKEYINSLKQKNREFRREEKDRKRSKSESFYEDDYDDEYDNDHDSGYDDEGYDDEYEDEYYEDEYSQSPDEEYDDDYDDSYKKLSSFDFFGSCNTKESLDKKYRSLVKLYHPDNMDGDTKALQEINVQYNEAKKRF